MKVLTFGEIMLRLKAPGHERFFQSPMLEATFGGGDRQRPCNKQTDCSGADFIRPLSFADVYIQLISHNRHLHGNGKPHSRKSFPSVLRLARLYNIALRSLGSLHLHTLLGAKETL